MDDAFEPPATWSATWRDASWLNPPPRAVPEGQDLLVETEDGSDLWRTTSYGFVHDSGHALLAPFPDRSAIEVRFVLDYRERFDQAGVLVRAHEEAWVKAGVEVSDGTPQVGAVVTRGVSDWSVTPVPDWWGREVTVRASRAGDALTVRARVDAEPWQLVRLAPLPAGRELHAGPYCCSPTRGGLRVRFRSAEFVAPDRSLHPEEVPAPDGTTS